MSCRSTVSTDGKINGGLRPLQSRRLCERVILYRSWYNKLLFLLETRFKIGNITLLLVSCGGQCRSVMVPKIDFIKLKLLSLKTIYCVLAFVFPKIGLNLTLNIFLQWFFFLWEVIWKCFLNQVDIFVCRTLLSATKLVSILLAIFKWHVSF